MGQIMMIRRIYILPFLSLLSILLVSASASPEQFNRLFIEAAGVVKPSVVNIVIYDRGERKGEHSYRKIADATGTIISGDGLVVTNYHVVARGNYYQIVTAGGRKYEISPFDRGGRFRADLKTAIALLRIDNSEKEIFPAVRFARSGNLQEGEWVLAIGNPYGLRQSITSGIISSTGRDNVGFVDFEDFIQSDFPINPGNSGGPLINLYGEMVGMNTAIRTVTGGYQGISFAIPSRIVEHVAEELISHGRVRRGWLGFLARERRQTGKGISTEVEISSIIKDSPADKTGLQEGDIIRKVDDMQVLSLGRLITLVGKKPVGSTVSMTVARAGRLKNFTLPLREKEEYHRIEKGVRRLFISYGIEVDESIVTHNAIISYVSPQNAAYDISRGDRIVSMNGVEVKGLDDFIRIFYRSGMVIEKMELRRENMVFEIRFPQSPARESDE
jgi:S1-C subfamily serine protease